MGKLRNSDHDHDHDDQVLLPTNKKQKQRMKKKKKKEPMKITYISSPTLVKAASASEFRALVQELTGKDSRVGEEESYEYCSPVSSAGGGGSSVEDRDQVVGTSGVDELDYNDYFVSPEDGYLSKSVGDVVTAAAVEEEAAAYSTVEMEEGGFSMWRDVPDGFGNLGGLNQYSFNCVFV
ncbi:hypothetical protein LINGRAHAP2_LOCUS17803 [Linum grandiflorum]